MAQAASRLHAPVEFVVDVMLPSVVRFGPGDSKLERT